MATSRASFICSSCLRTLHSDRRLFSSRQPTTDPLFPRWKQTPPQMKAPTRVRPLPQRSWAVNSEQEPLDAMYDRFLSQIANESGKKGRDMLPDEVKWLAITHKSFDHGRQGFNDKLAYIGKRLIELETTLALRRAPQSISILPGPTVYNHASLEGVENMTLFSRDQVLDRVRLASLASQYGIDKVMRWKPKNPDSLVGSGVETVLTHTLYSIVGALTLHKGGDIARRAVRQKLLVPLGLST